MTSLKVSLNTALPNPTVVSAACPATLTAADCISKLSLSYRYKILYKDSN